MHTMYIFQVYNLVTQNLCCVPAARSPVPFRHRTCDPLYPLHSPPTPFPSDNPHFIVCDYKFGFFFVFSIRVLLFFFVLYPTYE